MSISNLRLRQEKVDAIRLYYRSPKFALIDLSFGFLAFFQNPYRTCRKFLQKKKAENIYAYGETPYTTYQKMIQECGITAEDTWIEMGAGRGKGCFWLAHFTKCRVIGIERIPQFVRFARFLKVLFRMKKISFERRDIETADLSKATVIYLYGIWPNIKMPSHVKVITISEPLEGCQVLKRFWVRFPWGRTTAYLQIANPSTLLPDG